MIKIFSLCTFLFTIFLSTPSIHAAALSRDRIIQQEMDCMAKQADGVTWSDVCYTNNQVSDQRLAAIDAQLNQIELVQPEATQVVSSQEGIIIPPVVDPKPAYPFAKKHNFDFGQETYYYRYREPSVEVFNTGMMYGYYGNYDYRPEEGNVLNNEVINVYGLQGEYARGDLDYKGSGIDKGVTNKTYEVRGILGKDYILSDNSRVTPYVGLAYRYLIDRHGGRLSSTNFYGYNRESNYYYMPIGVTIDIPDIQNVSVGMNLEYDYFLQGLQKSRLSDGDQFNGLGNDDFRNDQEKGYGIRVSLKFLRKYSMFDLYVEPFIRFWDIEESQVMTGQVEGAATSLVEPQNTTTEIGSKFGLKF